MSLEYAETGGWKGGKNQILRRNDALELLYDLYPKSSGIFVVAGVGVDEELEYVKELAKDSNRKIYIFQPDNKVAMQLRNLLKNYNNVQIIEDYTFNCGKYLPKSSVERFYALNIVNWKPQRFLTLLKNILDSLSETGELIISFYVHIWPFATDKKYLIDTPREIVGVFNSFAEPLTYYYDNNGLLAVYTLSKSDLKRIYKELKRVKKNEIEQRKLSYQIFFE